MLTDKDKEYLDAKNAHTEDLTPSEQILIDIIDRQGKALEKCIEQRDDWFDPEGTCPPNEAKQILDSYNQELEKIMRGEG